MKISENWTKKERLDIVGKLSGKMSQMNNSAREINQQLVELFGQMSKLGTLLTLLHESDAQTLESNREQIMKFIQNS